MIAATAIQVARKGAAILLLSAGPLLGLAVALGPHLYHWQLQIALAELEEQRARLALAVSRAKSRSSTTQASERKVSGKSAHLIAAATPSAAGAVLQETVVGLIRKHGGQPSVSEIVTMQAEDRRDRIAVRVSGVIPLAGLRGALAELEGGSPMLFIDQLGLRSGAERKLGSQAVSEQPLAIEMKVSAAYDVPKSRP